MAKPPAPPESRFFPKVAFVDKWHSGTRCLEWQGYRHPVTGYGVFYPHTAGGRSATTAHRWLYERWSGPIPEGLQIDHLCRNRACCNPAHLEPVTVAENLRRSPLTLATVNRTKTECVHGHPFDEANTYVRIRNGSRRRECLTCRAEADARCRQRRANHGGQ